MQQIQLSNGSQLIFCTNQPYQNVSRFTFQTNQGGIIHFDTVYHYTSLSSGCQRVIVNIFEELLKEDLSIFRIMGGSSENMHALSVSSFLPLFPGRILWGKPL